MPGNPEIWNKLWNNRTIPKIEIFNWTLMHGRILTGENLEKRGIVGPFRFPLCADAAETINHLFLNCPYATTVWMEVLKRWGNGRYLPVHIHECFINWDNLYQGDLNEKKGVKACWMKIPQIICWIVWKERNQRIFQGKTQPVWKLAAKAMVLLGEVVSISKIPNNKETLTENEKD